MRVEGCAWTVEKEEEEAEKLEKNSSPFVFLSFGRRLVLKRWSQKFSFEYFNFCFCAAPRYKNTRALLIRKPKTRRARKKTAVFALPPPSSSRARSLLLLPLDFFCFAPRFRACWGKFRETKTEREREEGCGERRGVCSFFISSYFFASLSLSLSPSLSLLPCCCFVFSSRLTKQQQQLSSPHKKSKSASRARV